LEGLINHLTEMQEIDNKISEVLTQKKTFPKKIDELTGKLKEDRDVIENLKASLLENEKERKRLQDNINVENDRLERVDGKLPQIKTNKEYQALIKEMDNMRKEISRCEDGILKLLEEEEQLKAGIKEKGDIFETEEKEINSRISGYESEISKFDEKIRKFETEKRYHTKNVDSGYLKTYERIKARRDGVAVIATIDGVCQGCYMNIPPQLFNLIQKSSEIHTCPNCSRILYWKEEVG
jgi:predicted  nucleic acid-binding Zn-ribbon protein